ncbi:unnamed protein product [Clonostachys rhizophaga]|uniref:Zn(2)-C6 fungal-type domain-containing protein n=1 Tax=Clonostachys rhizophaga TaxID=160324 RepID=A0A9N9VJA0_9HYPO|nr:unnamed protein product [Clonostachys rhizophaga]
MPQTKMPHRKVRTGCIQCKKRRVKCDETKPTCQKCAWHTLDCSYAAPLKSPAHVRPDDPPFSFEDFGLLRHWDEATAVSLAPNRSLQVAMREVVPLLATHHKFLMHALLSLTSLHLAYLHPEESEHHEGVAARHQNFALPLFRSALASVTEQNCHAIYACGHLITKYAFAKPRSRHDLLLLSGTDTPADLLSLLRGSFAIYDYAFEWLSTGPLGDCLEEPLEKDPDSSKTPADRRLAHLSAWLSHRGGGSDKDHNISSCCDALNNLRRLFAMDATPGQTMSTKTLAYSWPTQVSDKYIQLVFERYPEALIVLAHFCIMLMRVDGFWFMRGSAKGILKQCWDHLSSDLRRHIQWPLDVVGLGD